MSTETNPNGMKKQLKEEIGIDPERKTTEEKLTVLRRYLQLASGLPLPVLNEKQMNLNKDRVNGREAR
ncbi:MAG: hypothetical protein ACFFD4_23700 [Candidatus Odinarchaeota archaeon]